MRRKRNTHSANLYQQAFIELMGWISSGLSLPMKRNLASCEFSSLRACKMLFEDLRLDGAAWMIVEETDACRAKTSSFS